MRRRQPITWPLGRPVSCSSEPEPHNPCSNIVDGDVNSRWSAWFPARYSEQSPNWWWIDGLYMAMPVYAELCELFNDETLLQSYTGQIQWTPRNSGDCSMRLRGCGTGTRDSCTIRMTRLHKPLMARRFSGRGTMVGYSRRMPGRWKSYRQIPPTGLNTWPPSRRWRQR